MKNIKHPVIELLVYFVYQKGEYQVQRSSHIRRHTNRWYGVKGTKVDQSCFNDSVKWTKALVSEPAPQVHRGDAQLREILKISTRQSGNGKSLPLKQTLSSHSI